MITLLIVADDFTGALDTGVQLAGCGAPTRVVTDPEFSPANAAGAEVLVIDAETRHLPPSQAGAIVEGIVRRAVEQKVPYIYKKTDSALRGNVGAELGALLAASGEKALPFLPAYPQIDRCTRGGVHYIEGRPVAKSVFGIDPFEPVRHSDIAGLIGAQSGVPVHSLPADAPAPEGQGIYVYDASSLADLERAGQTLAAAGRLHISAGCAGFGAVLPRLLGLGRAQQPPKPRLDPRLLVVCGSVNPITVAQLDAAEEAGFARLRLTPRQKLEPGYWNTPEGEADRARIEALLQANPRVLLDSNDAGGNGLTADYAAGLGCGLEEMRVRIASSIGDLVAGLLHSPAVGTLLMTGGDTLLQVMRCAGVRELEPLCELEKGVVLARCTYRGCTRHVITKSGGFGQAALLTDLAARLEAQAEENRNRSER